MGNQTYKPNILVTGATGFLGRQFVRDILTQTDCNVYAVVRDDKTSSVSARNRSEIDQIFNYTGLKKEEVLDDRLHIITGDITKKGVIGRQDYVKLPPIDEVWHVAASVQFSEKPGQEGRIAHQNIEGTQRVIDLVSALKPRKFFNISTAYVVGTNPIAVEKFREQSVFRNPYEETKYEGEKLVRDAVASGKIENAVYLRPGIIVGNPKTGESDDKTIYAAINTCHKLMTELPGPRMVNRFFKEHLEKEHDILKWFFEQTPLYLRGSPASKKNLITVDDVSGLMMQAKTHGKMGKTYHLVNPHDTYVGEIHDCMARVFQERYPNLPLNFVTLVEDESELESLIEGYGKKELPGVTKARKTLQRMLQGGMNDYVEYLTSSDAHFSINNTSKDLIRGGNGYLPQFMTDDLQMELYRNHLSKL